MKSIFITGLISGLALVLSSTVSVQAVSNADLLELEKQIEQQEAEDKESEQRAIEDLRRKTEARELKEQQQRLELERTRVEKERHALEALKQDQDNKRKNIEQEKLQKEKERETKFDHFISAAKVALDNKDRDTAISQFEQALAIIPDDFSAKQGLSDAQKLKDKVCYDVLGEWHWNDGDAKLILHDNGTLDYISWGNHTGNWQCSNPASRQIHIEITALGFTQDWNPVLSEDKACLAMKLSLVGPGCLYHPNSNNPSVDNETKKSPAHGL